MSPSGKTSIPVIRSENVKDTIKWLDVFLQREVVLQRKVRRIAFGIVITKNETKSIVMYQSGDSVMSEKLIDRFIEYGVTMTVEALDSMIVNKEMRNVLEYEGFLSFLL
jgi:hypothetical protein